MNKSHLTIKDCVKALKNGKIGHYDIPKEIQKTSSIITVERRIGIRIVSRCGYDVINDEFFVEDLIKISPTSSKTEKTTFSDFRSYFLFLNGNIYENACYYQYIFSDEEIEKYNIKTDKINYISLINKKISDSKAAFSIEELSNYDKIEVQKGYRKKWIDRLIHCNDYAQFKAIISKIKKSIFQKEIKFFVFAALSSQKEQHLSAAVEYIIKNMPYYLSGTILRMEFGTESAKNMLINFKESDQDNEKIIKYIEEFDSLFKQEKVTILRRSYFDEKTHFYKFETSVYREGYPSIITFYKTFGLFIDLANFLNHQISNCDISTSLEPIDISNLEIGDNVRLPIQYYKDLRYFSKKLYDRCSKKFIVKQAWKDINNQIIKFRKYDFDYFFDFIYFCEKDLSDADLIFCDGLSNLKNHDTINFTNAKLRSCILKKFNISYDETEVARIKTNIFQQIHDNENITNEVIYYPPNYHYDSPRNSKIIFYISDLHLSHKIRAAGCRNKYDIIYLFQNIIDKLLYNILWYKRDVFIFAGDTSSDFETFSLFVTILNQTIRQNNLRINIIFVLGNHELWGFEGATVNDIVSKYNSLLLKNDMFLLQNNILYTNDNGEIKNISTEELLKYNEQTLKEALSHARTILFGGLAFSGYCEKFNAINGIYQNTISPIEDHRQTLIFENLYNKICKSLYNRHVLIVTHMPVDNWNKRNKLQDGFIYIHGHTHKNYSFYHNNVRLYADNQIGYYNQNIDKKFFYLEDEYDVFGDYNDGIYLINRDQYLDFYHGKKIPAKFNRPFNELYMLKRNGYYCFIVTFSNGNWHILNAGEITRLRIHNIDYYYDNMLTVIKILSAPLDDFTNYQRKISNEIQKIGGSGYIHGCIIDINYFNHIYVNPLDYSITSYWAASPAEKIIYQSIPKLLKEQCPSLYAEYKRQLENKHISSLSKINMTQKKSSGLYLETDIYTPSNQIKKMQKIYKNILTVWIDPPKPSLQSSNITS